MAGMSTRRIDGSAAEADVEVLVWSDIVQDVDGSGDSRRPICNCCARPGPISASGALFRLMRLRKGPMIAALYPVVMLLAQLLVALLAGLGAGALVGAVAAGPWAWLGAAAGWRWSG